MQGLVATPLVGIIRPDTLPVRDAAFVEVGNSILMTVALPGLFPKGDLEALDSIDSGFDTILEFTIRVWKHTPRHLVTSQTHTVKLRRDPWKKRYVVSTLGRSGWTRRYFGTREAAMEAAYTLQRFRICSSSQLQRGASTAYYFASILALRNPLSPREASPRVAASGRSRGRDLEWFERIVEVFAGERARAEQVVHVRTKPFYLVPR